MADRWMIDAAGIIALLHGGDARHEACGEAFRAFQGALGTTEAAVADAMAALSRTRGGGDACLEFILRGGAEIFDLTGPMRVAVKTLIRKGRIAYGTATVIAAARGKGVRTVFTADRALYRGSGLQAVP